MTDIAKEEKDRAMYIIHSPFYLPSLLLYDECVIVITYGTMTPMTTAQPNPTLSTPPAPELIVRKTEQASAMPFNPLSIFKGAFSLILSIIRWFARLKIATLLFGFIAILTVSLLIARSKVLAIIDMVDKELYTIEDMTLEGTIKVGRDVTIGSTIPTGEIVEKLNAIPSSIPIDTSVPISTTLDLDTDLPLSTSIPITAISNSTLEIPGFGNLQPITIPINTTSPLNTTLPLDTIVPISSTIPFSFDIPISQSIRDQFNDDIDISTTIPINAQIPVQLDVSESNITERFSQWHIILNKVRSLLIGSEKTKAEIMQTGN